MEEPTVVSCKIGPYPDPRNMWDLILPKVKVTLSDGVEKELFEFYPDELSFTESEFIGLTERQARGLFRQKDLEYLRS